MANGPGVSRAERADGRWRVRWRELVEEDGEQRWVARERVVQDEAAAIRLQASILRARDEGRVWAPEARTIERVATVDDVAGGWLRARAARGLARSTIARHGSEVTAILGALRALNKIPVTHAVAGAYLTRTQVVAVTEHLRGQGLGAGSVYNTISTLLAMWVWAADDPDRYPGLAPPPRDLRAVKPRAAIYAAPEAPLLSEVDAVIRRVRAMPRAAHFALPIAVIARWTGLRVSSIVPIRVEHVHLRACTLEVAADKVRTARRVVAMAEGLCDYLAPLVAEAREAGREQLLKRSRHVHDPARGLPAETLATAWTAAVEAGEVRPEAWRPPTRRIGRPDHAMRAAFQDHLVRAGVRDEVIDLLVGHVPRTTRGRHYVTAEARMEAMREAVALLPEIDWRRPEERPANVVEMPRRRR